MQNAMLQIYCFKFFDIIINLFLPLTCKRADWGQAIKRGKNPFAAQIEQFMLQAPEPHQTLLLLRGEQRIKIFIVTVHHIVPFNSILMLKIIDKLIIAIVFFNRI